MLRTWQTVAIVGLFFVSLPAAAQDPQATECDRLAAHEDDDRAVAPGVPWDRLDGAAALGACTAAVSQNPQAARLHLQLGRALHKLEGYDEALAAYRHALRLQPEYSSAHANLGYLYHNGLGVARDDAQAAEHYRAAAGHGHTYAMFQLGLLAASGEGVEQDQAEAAAWYLRAAELGYGLAQENLGRRYRFGNGVEQDYAEAMKWSRRAADQGLPGAQTEVGFLFRRGLGVEPNSTEAARWYRLAADQGNRWAIHNLGTLYERGDGVPKDIKQAIEYFERAAEQDHPPSLEHLAWMYAHGEHVEKNYHKARQWFEKAAAADSLEGQYGVAWLYYYGFGVEKNLVEALRRFKPVAEKGHQWSCFFMGRMHEMGEAVPVDYAAAAGWYRRALEQGELAGARRFLDGLYTRGLAVPPPPQPLVLQRAEQEAAAPSEPTIESLRATALPAEVQIGETVGLRLVFTVAAGAAGRVEVRESRSLRFGGKLLPNFPVESANERASGSHTTTFEQRIPPVAAPGEYEYKGEVCVGGDCIARTTAFRVLR